MRVSVITVVRNGRDLIGATLDSIVGQTWGDREIIVVDGLSTDGTLDVIKRYSDRIHRLIVEPDNGIYDAMNKGIAAATGDWLIFMNAGDVFNSAEVLERVAGLLKDERPLLCGRYEKVWNGRSVLFDPQSMRPGVMPSSHQATFVSVDVARQNLFDLSLRVGSDYDQICRITRGSSEPIQFTDIVIATVEGDGYSSSNPYRVNQDYRNIIIRHFGRTRGWAWYIRTVVWITATSLIRAIVPHAVTARVRRFRSGARSA